MSTYYSDVMTSTSSTGYWSPVWTTTDPGPPKSPYKKERPFYFDEKVEEKNEKFYFDPKELVL